MGKGPCPLAGVAENLWPLFTPCPQVETAKWAWIALLSVAGAASNKLLLPLWLCIVFTAYMFGRASLGLCVGSLDS